MREGSSPFGYLKSHLATHDDGESQETKCAPYPWGFSASQELECINTPKKSPTMGPEQDSPSEQ